MSSIANPLTTNSTTGSASGTTTTPIKSSGDPLANESTFLTLLVSQLQNQDPLNPPDSSQFVSQLTSYSQLEQLIDINKNTVSSAGAATGTTPTTTTGS